MSKMKPMRSYTTHIIIGLFALTAFTPFQLRGQEQQDAVYQKLVHEYTLQPDGSIDYHHFRQLRIESYYAFHRRFGETFVIYNTDFERLSVNEAFTIMADGKRIPLPDNALNEVLPRHAESSPPFNNLREMVITHTGLEKGATIYLDYTLRRFPAQWPVMSGAQVLAEDVPVKEMSFILRAPSDIIIHHKLINADIEPVVTTRNGMTEYRYEFRDLEPLVTPPHSASPFYRAPAILFSTSSGMDQLRTTLTRQDAFKFEADPDMILLADSLRKKHDHPLSLGLALQELVHKSVATWPVSLRESGLKVRTAAEVWNSGGGNAAEKAVLMTAFCRAAGLKASVHIRAERILFDRGIAMPEVWSEFLVRLETPSKSAWLDPLHLHSGSMDQASVNKYLIPLDPKEALIEQPAPEIPSVIQMQALLEYTVKNGLIGNVDLTTSGAACPEFLLAKGDEAWKATGRINGYLLEREDKKGKQAMPCSFSFAVKSEEAPKTLGGYTHLLLPVPGNEPGILSRPLVDYPHIPTVLAHPVSLSYEWTITLPNGYRLAGKIPDEEIGNAAGSYRSTIRQDKNKLIIRRTLEISAMILKDREGFSNLVNAWQSPHWKGIYIVGGRE